MEKIVQMSWCDCGFLVSQPDFDNTRWMQHVKAELSIFYLKRCVTLSNMYVFINLLSFRNWTIKTTHIHTYIANIVRTTLQSEKPFLASASFWCLVPSAIVSFSWCQKSLQKWKWFTMRKFDELWLSFNTQNNKKEPVQLDYYLKTSF